jgi:cell division septation protein DedD
MEDNSKLFVFEKKEVALIFLFIVIISITAFTLGVRVGKKLVQEKVGITQADIKTIELKSPKEEYVDEVITTSDPDEQGVVQDEHLEKIDQALKELKKSDFTPESVVEENMVTSPNDVLDEVDEPVVTPTTTRASTVESLNVLKGKFTVQLGSYDNVEDATNFAEGFVARGYDPIINQVQIPGKGTWFRVSLGTFDTITQAKEYIKKEQTLFQGQDYIIKEFK